MKHLRSFLFAGALAFVAVLPMDAKAYFTTDQTATRATENAAIYTITYTFGSPNRDTYMPIAIQRDSGDFEHAITYEMLIDGTDLTDAGETIGLVLSDAEIKDNQYFVPAGTSKTFVLYVILTTPITAAEADYALHVTDLPFTTINEDDDTIVLEQGLTPSELSYYQTPEVELNVPLTAATVPPSYVEMTIEPSVETVEPETNITVTPNSAKFRFANPTK